MYSVWRLPCHEANTCFQQVVRSLFPVFVTYFSWVFIRYINRCSDKLIFIPGIIKLEQKYLMSL